MHLTGGVMSSLSHDINNLQIPPNYRNQLCKAAACCLLLLLQNPTASKTPNPSATGSVLVKPRVTEVLLRPSSFSATAGALKSVSWYQDLWPTLGLAWEVCDSSNCYNRWDAALYQGFCRTLASLFAIRHLPKQQRNTLWSWGQNLSQVLLQVIFQCPPPVSSLLLCTSSCNANIILKWIYFF